MARDPGSGRGRHRSSKGELSIRTEDPLGATNPHYLRVIVHEPGGYALRNNGFRGIGVESGAEYRFSAYVRGAGPKVVRATLTDESGHGVGSGKLEGFTGNGNGMKLSSVPPPPRSTHS